MSDAILQLSQPPGGDLGEDRAFVRNRLLHHDVERAYPVRRNEQDSLLVDVVHVAHLAATQNLERKRARLHQHQTRISSAISGRLTSLLNNGVMTSRKNSSTCSGARPTKRSGSIAPRRSSSLTPKDLSRARRSRRSFASAPSLSARAVSRLCLRIVSWATWRSPPARTARTISCSVAMNGSSAPTRRAITAGGAAGPLTVVGIKNKNSAAGRKTSRVHTPPRV